MNEGPYTKLNSDPTRKLEGKVHKVVTEIKDQLATYTKQLTPRFCKPPHIYGLPKIHKEGYPLRIIVSSINSPCQKLARFLLDIIKPVGGKGNSHIINSQDFVQKVRNIKVENWEILASFDVCNLFPSVPKLEALNALKQS